MRKLAIAFVVLGMALVAVPAFAVLVPAGTDEVYTGLPGPGGAVRSTNDCPGGIVWDAGMFDEFVPPAGSSSATASACFIAAIDSGGIGCTPCDTRRIADEWEVTVPTTITGLKLWSRYSACGNDYHLYNIANNIVDLHGFCVKIWEQDAASVFCPDGTIPGENAIGPLVYDQYVTTFSEHMITTGPLLRNWNYCITLPAAPPFVAQPGKVYYMSASADFDFVGWDNGSGVVGATQFFVRMYTNPSPADDYTPYCMGSVYSDGNMFAATNWIDIATNSPTAGWPGWNVGYVVYGDPFVVVEGACCDGAGNCTVTVEAQCVAPSTWHSGVPCSVEICPPVPTETKSWGQIKRDYK
jgi:hypothetical protein